MTQPIGHINYTRKQVIHDTIPSYRINYLPERYNENLLKSTNLTLEQNNQIMKKLNLIQQYKKQMEVTEDQIIEKHAEQCKHCSQNTSLPYEYEITCISCGFNLIKENTNLLKINKKK